ncbi:MAG: hypothetical protein M1837_002944 [Sclerophora amabilis]|nr:MAG: hypothetical protein M1837_002944 [Sclerophora amabilis]
MDALLPDDVLLQTLNDNFPCRELQIRQLAHLLWPPLPSPSTLLIHGLEATGKSAILNRLLASISVPCAIVKSAECITVRHLLERTVASCEDALNAVSSEPVERAASGRCENVSSLAVHLERLLRGRSKFILAFDGIDRQREAPPTLLPALARIGEIIPNLTTILILTSPRPRFLHSTGIPHVHFPPYTKAQSIKIVSASARMIFESSNPDAGCQDPQDRASARSQSPQCDTTNTAEEAEDSAWVWTRFCSAVWDSLAKGAARDIVSFRAVCDRLWRPFVAPIVDGTYGTREFSKLMVARRALFQDGEVLIERVTIPRKERDKVGRPDFPVHHELPYYSKYLLCAAYLASYNPARQDQALFTKGGGERKRRKKGGGTAAGRAGNASSSKHRKINRKLLGAKPFILERLLAIFHVIVPNDIVSNADILTQISTLSSLRLLTRTSSSLSADLLEPQTKYRVNVGWEYIRRLGRGVDMEMENWIAE